MYRQYSKGIIEIITGPMFSGKSEELIKRIKILNYAGIKTLIVKPEFDSRFSKQKIISRSGGEIETFTMKNSEKVFELLKNDNYKAVALDEAQFFADDLIKTVKTLADKGLRVMISGLDTDFTQKPFGPMPYLMAIADSITKLKAVCFVCKKAAGFSFRTIKNKNLKVLGDFDSYEARCRVCHFQGEKIKKIL